MRKLVSIAICGLAAAFALPATAADENTAKARAGANASVEGGAALGGTGVSLGHGTADGNPRTGDTQARRDNNTNDSKATEKRAKRKTERDASSGATRKSD
jgi:hypothetical protein